MFFVSEDRGSYARNSLIFLYDFRPLWYRLPPLCLIVQKLENLNTESLF